MIDIVEVRGPGLLLVLLVLRYDETQEGIEAAKNDEDVCSRREKLPLAVGSKGVGVSSGGPASECLTWKVGESALGEDRVNVS